MTINEILEGSSVTEISIEEQKDVLDQMSDKKVFDLEESERLNLINFLCENVETNLATNYLFHVLDTEVPYPVDEEKIKSLFSDVRMRKLKDIMMEKIQTEEKSEIED